MARPARYVEVADNVARDLAAWHRGRPSTSETYLVMRRLHQLTAGWSSRTIRTAMRVTPWAVDRLGSEHRSPASPSVAEAVPELRREGLASLAPVLSEAEIASLAEFARRAPAIARHANGRRTPGTYESDRESASAIFVEGRFAWARPEVQRVLADPQVWAVAREYFGMVPVIQPPQLYWTCVDADVDAATAVSLARNYHWDYDGIGSLRLVVYLTDVDEGSAPMEYVTGSHRAGALRTRELRYADEGDTPPEALATLGLSHGTPMLGPAGSTFITDAFGLHRANPARTHDRLVMIVPMQAGSFAGYYQRARRVPVRDPRFADALAAGRPELRLFRPGDPAERVVTLADDERAGSGAVAV